MMPRSRARSNNNTEVAAANGTGNRKSFPPSAILMINLNQIVPGFNRNGANNVRTIRRITVTAPACAVVFLKTATVMASASSTVPASTATGPVANPNQRYGRERPARHRCCGTNPPANSNLRPVIHYVKEGETLWAIAQQYYGDGGKWTVDRQQKQRQPAGR